MSEHAVDRGIADLQTLIDQGITRWSNGNLIAVDLAFLVVLRRIANALEAQHDATEYRDALDRWGDGLGRHPDD